jgi:hypothetical protein
MRHHENMPPHGEPSARARALAGARAARWALAWCSIWMAWMELQTAPDGGA